MTFINVSLWCPRLLLAVVAITVLSGHVAPSVDDNNRYLKVTPLADGVRLAYTVFFGEIPGASERRKLDLNRDGVIDPTEAKSFGDKLAIQIAAALQVEADGKSQTIRWHSVDVGLGSEAVAAGSFSLDFVAFVCLPGRGPHRFGLRDQFRIPRPGETEVKVEDSPGVTIQRARVGEHDDPSHDYRFVGPGGVLSDEGLDLQFTPTATTPTVPGGKCQATAATSKAGRPPWLLIAAIAVGLALVVVVVVKLRAS